MSSKEMLDNSNNLETPNDESAPRSSHCSTSLVDAIETVELWVDLWADDQAEIEEVSPCDVEERKVIAAVHVVLNAIKSKGSIPNVGDGYKLCSHKVAESYWDGQVWRDLGPCQAGADWYRRRTRIDIAAEAERMGVKQHDAVEGLLGT